MPRATKSVAASKRAPKGSAKPAKATEEPADTTAKTPAKTAPKAAKAPSKKAPAAKKAAKAPVKSTAKTVAKKTAAVRKRVTKPALVEPATLDAFQKAQQSALLAERATYERQADSLQAEADQLAAEREPGDVQFDEESGEGDTLAVERERDLALSAQARSAVDEIDAALARLAAGTYGVCERCGQNIPKERLRALPHAALCVTCKTGGLGRL